MGHYLISCIFAAFLTTMAAPKEPEETYGDGVAAYSLQNYAKAREIWTRLAENGDARSIFRLADLYARGLGGDKDIAVATKYYCDAAEAGHAEGAYFCGKSKKESGQGGIEEYKKAAALGHRKAQYYLANFYVSGDGVEKNYPQAYELYKSVSAVEPNDQLGKLAAQMMKTLDGAMKK